MGYTITISLRVDEREKIKELMKEYDANRHEIIKLAIRRFLFPEEAKVPLNGREAQLFSVKKNHADKHFFITSKKGESG